MREIHSDIVFLVDVSCQRCPSKDWILDQGQPSLCARCKHPIPKYKYASKDEEKSYLRANDLLTSKDFDLALESFKTYLKAYPNNPNAVIGLLLAQYQISYDFDEKANRYIPRNHAIDLPPNIEKELLYKQAIALFNQLGDVEAIHHWKSLTDDINKTIKEFNLFAKSASSCDVFISFKHTEQTDKGEWVETKDAVIAESIYHHLLTLGYTPDQVFFSKIDNQNFTGDFEAKIYHKLKTAKIFILVGTSEEKIESPWVKNEWARYYAMIGKGKKHPDSMLVVLENKEKFIQHLDSRIKRLNLLPFSNDNFVVTLEKVINQVKEKIGVFSPDLSKISLDTLQSIQEDDFNESDLGSSQVVIDFHDYEVTDIERAKENEMHILWEQGNKDKVYSIASNLLESYPRNSTAFLYLFLIEAHIDDLAQLSTTSWLNDQGDLQTFFNYMTSLQETHRRERIEQIIHMVPLAIKEKKPLIYSLLHFLFLTKDLIVDTSILNKLETSLYAPCLAYSDVKLFEVITQFNNSTYTPKIAELSLELLKRIPSMKEGSDASLKLLYQHIKFDSKFVSDFPGSIITKRVLSKEGKRLLTNPSFNSDKPYLIFQKILLVIPDKLFVFRWLRAFIEGLFASSQHDLANVFILALQQSTIRPDYLVLYKALSQFKLNKISDLSTYPSLIGEDYLYPLKDKILSLSNKTLSHLMLSIVDQYEISKQHHMLIDPILSVTDDLIKVRMDNKDQIAYYKPKVFSKVKPSRFVIHKPMFVMNTFFDSIQQESIEMVILQEGTNLRFKGTYTFKKDITLLLLKGSMLHEGDYSTYVLSDLTLIVKDKHSSDLVMAQLLRMNLEHLGQFDSDEQFNRLSLIQLTNVRSLTDQTNLKDTSTLSLNFATLLALPLKSLVDDFIQDSHLKPMTYLPLLMEAKIRFSLSESVKLDTCFKSSINRSDYAILLKKISLYSEISSSSTILNHAQLLALHPFEETEPLKVFELLWDAFTLNDIDSDSLIHQWIQKQPLLLKNKEVKSRLSFFLPTSTKVETAIKKPKVEPTKIIPPVEVTKPILEPVKIEDNSDSIETFMNRLNNSSIATAKALFQQLVDLKKSGNLKAYYHLGFVVMNGFTNFPASLVKGLEILEEGCSLGSQECCKLFLETAKKAILNDSLPKTVEWRNRYKEVEKKFNQKT